MAVDFLTAVLSSDSEQTASATSSASKLKPRVIGKVINCICEQNVDTPPLTQVCHVHAHRFNVITCNSYR